MLAINWALQKRDQYDITLVLHKRKISLDGVETRHIPLDNRDDILEEFRAVRPHFIVHAAGLTGVEECENNPEYAFKVNVELAENVARVCKNLDIPLVHISTDHLFKGDFPYATEESPVSPVNIYAQTKAEAEARVLNTKPDALVIRTNFFGWGMSYRKSFSDIIISSLRNKQALCLFKDIYYSPILITTLVDVVHLLLEKNANGIFNVVGDERISKHQFGKIIAEIFQLDQKLIMAGKISDNKNLTHRPEDMSLSNKKVCELLGKKLGGVEDHARQLLKLEKNGFAQLAQKL